MVICGAPTTTSPSPSPSRSPTATAAPKEDPSQLEVLVLEPQPNEPSNAPSGKDEKLHSADSVTGNVASAWPSITCTLLASEITRSFTSSVFTLPAASARPSPDRPPKQPMYSEPDLPSVFHKSTSDFPG